MALKKIIKLFETTNIEYLLTLVGYLLQCNI